MARLNIYLQDDLAASVKRAELEASAICQQALRDAVESLEKGIGTKREAVRAALRLRRTTPQGRREVGAADGARWAKEAATAKELQDIDRLVLEQLEGDEGDDPMYMVGWSDDASGGSQSFLHLGEDTDFETLGPWLQKHGSPGFFAPGEDLAIDADDYLAGFVDAAQRTWHELKPLIEEDEAVLRRRIELLDDMERNIMVRDSTTAPTSVEAQPEVDPDSQDGAST
ncbi:hypothetical protein [Arthrobacter sp. SRS-W-1-2016]|uniref:hypothetical protein n=1 Tax=Arthrobacter sp. SRS-W-1-2016 TaxID=1930254 RepID=UPI001116849B|nr:hypothetical protein [Arthrobacter sp. SRS-W-1-2016]